MICPIAIGLQAIWYATNKADVRAAYEQHRSTCDICRATMREYNRLAQAQTFDEQEWDKELSDGQHS